MRFSARFSREILNGRMEYQTRSFPNSFRRNFISRLLTFIHCTNRIWLERLISPLPTTNAQPPPSDISREGWTGRILSPRSSRCACGGSATSISLWRIYMYIHIHIGISYPLTQMRKPQINNIIITYAKPPKNDGQRMHVTVNILHVGTGKNAQYFWQCIV